MFNEQIDLSGVESQKAGLFIQRDSVSGDGIPDAVSCGGVGISVHNAASESISRRYSPLSSISRAWVPRSAIFP